MREVKNMHLGSKQHKALDKHNISLEGWLMHLASWFAFNTTVIVDTNSNPQVSYVK